MSSSAEVVLVSVRCLVWVLIRWPWVGRGWERVGKSWWEAFTSFSGTPPGPGAPSRFCRSSWSPCWSWSSWLTLGVCSNGAGYLWRSMSSCSPWLAWSRLLPGVLIWLLGLFLFLSPRTQAARTSFCPPRPYRTWFVTSGACLPHPGFPCLWAAWPLYIWPHRILAPGGCRLWWLSSGLVLWSLSPSCDAPQQACPDDCLVEVEEVHVPVSEGLCLLELPMGSDPACLVIILDGLRSLEIATPRSFSSWTFLIGWVRFSLR